MKSRVGVLITCTLGLWAITFFPARYLWGHAAVVYSLVALGLCLLPTSLTLIWAQRRPASSPQQHMLVAFGGTGLRMAFVLGGGLALSGVLPYFREPVFWCWLLVFYLFTLALEVFLLHRGRPTAG